MLMVMLRLVLLLVKQPSNRKAKSEVYKAEDFISTLYDKMIVKRNDEDDRESEDQEAD